ncbi:MAG TPA: FtsX-like permease family protein [Casimicrobiaceae bacterium]|nr:FtsX-like permease family protein [Casimicrobiaceae bacterium]
MTITRLALAYARRRPLATLLVVLLLAVGTSVVGLTMMITRELEARLYRDAEGIDLVVGAKGSPLQLVLAGVYHVDVPPGNIPLEAVDELRANPSIASAIPLALGDSLRGNRIVGTEPALVEHYRGRLAAGSMWQQPMEAVLGSDVARTSGLQLGSTFAGSHGLSDVGGEHADAPYRVVGVLAPSGSVMDRLVLTSVESVWKVHDAHQKKPGVDDDHDEHAENGGREVTLVLVRYNSPVAAASLPRKINSETNYVAASPAYETARLLSVFGVGIDLLRAFAYLLIAASALMLFVALAQALDERRYDLAILRALGAHRGQIAWVLLAESLTLAAIGAALGLAIAHGVAGLLARIVPAATPLAGAASTFHPEEVLVALVAIGAGILAALWPAWQAYRLDVAATLADT